MKHTTEELLFAAEVRKTAITLRAAAFQSARRHEQSRQVLDNTMDLAAIDAQQDKNQAALKEWEYRWGEEHPDMEYIEQALAAITQAADRIAGLTAKT